MSGYKLLSHLAQLFVSVSLLHLPWLTGVSQENLSRAPHLASGSSLAIFGIPSLVAALP